jgi:hypothetical protein
MVTYEEDGHGIIVEIKTSITLNRSAGQTGKNSISHGKWFILSTYGEAMARASSSDVVFMGRKEGISCCQDCAGFMYN